MPTAFITKDSAVVEVMTRARNAYNSWAESIQSDAIGLGKNKGVMGSDSFGRPKVHGLQADDEKDPPEAWIYSKRRGCLIPRRGKAGAVATAWLDAHQPPPRPVGLLHDFGMTETSGKPMGDGREAVYTAQLLITDDAVHVYHEGNPRSGLSRMFGGTDGDTSSTWTEEPLSAWHLALESAKAASREAVPA